MPDAPTLPETFTSSADLFARCLELGNKVRELRAIPETRRADTYDADRRKAGQDLLEANTEFDFACKMEGFVREYELLEARRLQDERDAEARAKGELRGPQAAFMPTGEARSAGHQFIESDAYKNREGGRTSEVEIRNLLTGTSLGTSGSQLFVPVGSPLYTPQTNRQRRLFVRDLLSVQNTNLSSVPYIRELNAGANEGGASAVQEASAKPEVTMQFEQDDAPIRKIAAWIQATMEALDDAPTLQGYIDTRLAYMVLLREEAEVLAGGGTAPHIKGIRDFSGIQTATGEFYDAVGSSIGKIENVDGDADGIVANPLDYWAAVTDRHSTVYDGEAFGPGGSPFQAPAPTAWGLPVVRSRSIESGKALVGSWRLGATMFEREGVTIRSTDSHASLFISNTVVILAEERVGLAVHRPDFFVLATISAPS